MNQAPRFLAFSSIVITISLLPSSAHAFTEDVCWLPDGGGVTDCTPLPAACLPLGTQDEACLTAAAVTYLQAGNGQYLTARSTIHTDAVFIAAQVVGFSYTDAYWIAAYDEATDLATFAPVSTDTGAPYGGPEYVTSSISGLVRNDFKNGGVYIHFSAPMNSAPKPVPLINGLQPDLNDPAHEVTLTHLRSWAMAAGESRPMCTNALTDETVTDGSSNYALGSPCYASNGAPAQINTAITELDGVVGVELDASVGYFSVLTGTQVLQDPDGGPNVSSTSFDQVVGGNVNHLADARLGVYIHALGDRTSHHVCLDQSYLYGPTDGGADWQDEMDGPTCAQGYHALRHIWESGNDYAQLAPEDRTTPAYLGNMYDELVTFATARGTLAANASNPSTRTALISALTGAISTTGAAARLAALHTITCDNGLVAFPGTPSCPGTADAGLVDQFPDGGAGSGSGGSDGGLSGDASLGGDAPMGTNADTSGSAGSGGTTDGDSANAADKDSGGCSTSTGGGGAGGLGALFALGLAIAGATRRRGR